MVNFIFDISIFWRVFMAFILSFSLIILLGQKSINYLRNKQGKGQPIRKDGPKSHLATKQGTPTMGGLLIIASTIFATLVFSNITNPFIIISITTFIIYGIMGFIDDYIKIHKQTSNAMGVKTKLFIQFFVSFISIAAITYYTDSNIQYTLNFPFIKTFSINLCYFYIPFAMVVVAGSSNAINLTDGLDGLVSGLLIFVLFVFLILAYIITDIRPIAHAQELSILCAALIGSLLAFLWFNFYPAQIFMGDTGSLALGALLGIISIMLKAEILFAIVGFVFVAEALSVMLQVASFKIRKKRIFKMAPLHHHFEQLGQPETKVVIRFWIMGFILMIIGFLAVLS